MFSISVGRKRPSRSPKRRLQWVRKRNGHIFITRAKHPVSLSCLIIINAVYQVSDRLFGHKILMTTHGTLVVSYYINIDG